MIGITDTAQSAINTIKQKKFNHIVKSLQHFWGTPRCMPYLKSLLENTDSDRLDRMGFPFEVLNAIGDLMEEHCKQYPELDTRGDDVWGKG